MQQTFATFCNNFHQGYEQKLFQLCYFLMSCVSDSPINAFFKNIIYTLEKWTVAAVFRFLVTPNSFLPSMFYFSCLMIISAQLFLYHKPVDIPRFCDILSDLSQLPIYSVCIQISSIQDSTIQLLNYKFQGLWFIF